MPRVVFCSPPTMMTSPPCTESAAPMTEKMSAWLEDVGSAATKVMRSQTIAPMRAATTISCVTIFASTMPLPTVFATASPESAPTRLSAPAMRIACAGVSTRVAMTVAIAFAASWKPLTNSNVRPRSTTRMSRTDALSKLAVLHHDGLDDVGDILATVDGDLDERVDVLPLDDLDRVVGTGEQLGDRLAPDLIALVLEGVDLDPMRLKALEALEAPKHDEHLARRGDEHLGLSQRRGPHTLHLEEMDELRDVIADIGDVIDLGAKADDVHTIERGHEGLVQMANDLVVELVSVVLDGMDVADLVLDLGEVGEELLERLRRLDGVLSVLLEEDEELALSWDQREAHRLLLLVGLSTRPRSATGFVNGS